MAIGDLRRGHPRRSGRRGLQALDLPGARHAPGDVAIYQFTTSSAVAGYLAEHRLPTDPRLPQLHGAPSCSPAGSRSSVEPVRRGPGEELARLAPTALLGLANERVQRADAAAGRVPSDGGGAGPGRLGHGHRRAGPAGGRRSWPPGAPRAAPTSSSWAAWCPPRPSTNSSRRSGPIAGCTTPGPGSTCSAARRVTTTPRRCRSSCDDLGLAGAVRMTGEVSDASLAAHFAAADVFLSLSVARGIRCAPGRGHGAPACRS